MIDVDGQQVSQTQRRGLGKGEVVKMEDVCMDEKRKDRPDGDFPKMVVRWGRTLREVARELEDIEL